MLSTRILLLRLCFFLETRSCRPLMFIECLNFLLNLSHGVRSFVMFIKIYAESNQLQLQTLVGYDWVFEKFTSAYLFQIAQEKSCDYLLIIYMKKFRNGKTEETHVYHAIRENFTPSIAPSNACACFENKRFDWPSVSFFDH